ncbi:hypothetical protein [Amycolatopsis sp. YIM 10]|uniref:hypothetical protein n=1 Tax=Amycolatopsis sp. YIM 10 TaxID=2653857 RepID=UPI002102313A|nr:hypothetical protein [Amycolatopsis sp. YIM 10]
MVKPKAPRSMLGVLGQHRGALLLDDPEADRGQEQRQVGEHARALGRGGARAAQHHREVGDGQCDGQHADRVDDLAGGEGAGVVDGEAGVAALVAVRVELAD